MRSHVLVGAWGTGTLPSFSYIRPGSLMSAPLRNIATNNGTVHSPRKLLSYLQVPVF